VTLTIKQRSPSESHHFVLVYDKKLRITNSGGMVKTADSKITEMIQTAQSKTERTVLKELPPLERTQAP